MSKNRMLSFLHVILVCTLASLTTTGSAQETKIPQTVQEHEARAKTYREQAKQYRAEATEHKRMSADYAKAHPPTKAMPNAPWLTKMAKHCDALVKDYEKLATDAEKAADYHELRAKELQGG